MKILQFIFFLNSLRNTQTQKKDTFLADLENYHIPKLIGINCSKCSQTLVSVRIISLHLEFKIKGIFLRPFLKVIKCLIVYDGMIIFQ